MKLLILGGYGTFGGRLAQLLADVAELEILIAGRSKAKAQAFCEGFDGAARVQPLALDRADIASALADHAPDLVVDASGPFQDYGTEAYRVVEAAVAAGIDYMDLADGADFVAGITAYDDAAKSAGISVLSGVSSFPVLTAAVLSDVAQRMDIRQVEGGIAPSPYAGVGQNVLRAVLGYAGAKVPLTRAGRPTYGRGLVETRRKTIFVPGHLPLQNIRFSLVDVPDLRLIPPEHPGLQDLWMGAGPVPEVLHRMLNGLARLRALGLVPRLTPLARLCHFVLNGVKFGEHRGGMYVTAQGPGGETETWNLIAEGEDGPLIPSMAIETLIRKRLAGHRPPDGARSGIGALDLSDYEALFATRDIVTGFHRHTPDAATYRTTLGPAMDDLPQAVQAFHSHPGTWSGTADVTAGTTWLGRIAARILGFPPPGQDVPVTVTITAEGPLERWTRHFGTHRLSTTQIAGMGRMAGLVVERFGPLAVGLALVVEDGHLRVIPRRATAFGLPVPRWALPGGHVYETQDGEAFVFHVAVTLPGLGHIVTYRGSLTPGP